MAAGHTQLCHVFSSSFELHRGTAAERVPKAGRKHTLVA